MLDPLDGFPNLLGILCQWIPQAGNSLYRERLWYHTVEKAFGTMKKNFDSDKFIKPTAQASTSRISYALDSFT